MRLHGKGQTIWPIAQVQCAIGAGDRPVQLGSVPRLCQQAVRVAQARCFGAYTPHGDGFAQTLTATLVFHHGECFARHFEKHNRKGTLSLQFAFHLHSFLIGPKPQANSQIGPLLFRTHKFTCADLDTSSAGGVERCARLFFRCSARFARLRTCRNMTQAWYACECSWRVGLERRRRRRRRRVPLAHAVLLARCEFIGGLCVGGW